MLRIYFIVLLPCAGNLASDARADGIIPFFQMPENKITVGITVRCHTVFGASQLLHRAAFHNPSQIAF